MPFDIKVALDMEEKKAIEAVKKSNVVDPLVKKLIDDAPETAKLKALVSLMEETVKDKDKMKKCREILNDLS
jgi:hypothetical protein